jgi:hydrogenase-4 component F
VPGTFLPFFAGFVGLAGLPPFGLFISELFILIGAFDTGRWLAGLSFIGCLVLVVAGAAPIFTGMSFAGRGGPVRTEFGVLRTVPPYVLLLTSVLLSVWMPEAIHDTIAATIEVLGGVIDG